MQVLLLEPEPDSLPGLLGYLKLNGSAGLPLHDSGSGPHPPIEGYIVDPESDQVTGPQLAVEGQVEKGQVPDAVSNLEPDPNGPDLLIGLRGGLGPISLPRFQGAVARPVWSAIGSCIAVLLMRSPPQ